MIDLQFSKLNWPKGLNLDLLSGILTEYQLKNIVEGGFLGNSDHPAGGLASLESVSHIVAIST